MPPKTLFNWIRYAARALDAAHAHKTPHWDVEIALGEARALAAAALGLTRAQLITRHAETLNDAQHEVLERWLSQRVRGVPLAHLTGRAHFWSLDLDVDPHCLVPRPDTEVLVEVALAHLPPGGTFVDLGTGTGAIACALGHERPRAWGLAIERSVGAARVARRNLARHASNVQLIVADWCDALRPAETLDAGSHPPRPAQPARIARDATLARYPTPGFAALAKPAAFDVIVSNPPYVRSGDPHIAADGLRREPLNALVAGHDGLEALRHIATCAPDRLVRGGWLCLEHGHDQGPAVRALLSRRGFEEITTHRDLSGHERITEGRWVGARRPARFLKR